MPWESGFPLLKGRRRTQPEDPQGDPTTEVTQGLDASLAQKMIDFLPVKSRLCHRPFAVMSSSGADEQGSPPWGFGAKSSGMYECHLFMYLYFEYYNMCFMYEYYLYVCIYSHKVKILWGK